MAIYILYSYSYLHTHTLHYQTQDLAAGHSKANNLVASVSRKERWFIEKSQQFGKKVNLCLEPNSAYSAQPWQFLKGKRGESQLIIMVGAKILHPFSTVCRPLTSPNLLSFFLVKKKRKCSLFFQTFGHAACVWDLSFQTRDWTSMSCIGSVES